MFKLLLAVTLVMSFAVSVFAADSLETEDTSAPKFRKENVKECPWKTHQQGLTPWDLPMQASSSSAPAAATTGTGTGVR